MRRPLSFPRARRSRRPHRTGLTLLEIMLVLVILGVMASMATMFLNQSRKSALMKTAKAEIGTFETAIDAYMLDMGSYPSESDGLRALLNAPSGTDASKWTGPYIKPNDLMDDWGNEYIYKLAGNGDQVVISSAGPDRQQGTEDDIVSNPLVNQ